MKYRIFLGLTLLWMIGHWSGSAQTLPQDSSTAVEGGAFDKTVGETTDLPDGIETENAPSWSHPLLPEAFWSFNRCGLDGSQILDSAPFHVKSDGTRYHIPLTRSGATCVNGPRLLRSAARFDGVDDLATTDENVLNFTNKLTASAWVYPERLTGTQTIVNKWASPDSYMLMIGDGDFIFALAFPEGYVAVRTPATSFVWKHVAGVFDGDTRKAKIYVNGVLKATVDTPGSTLQQSARRVSVGYRPPWNAFQGRIDEVGLYAAALSSAQVRALASKDFAPYHGADTSTRPWAGEYPAGSAAGYDIYLGSLGNIGSYCRIRDRYGRDILTGASTANSCSAFVYEAAVLARPERTYPFMHLKGPQHELAGSDKYQFGRDQATHLINRWTLYRHLIGGHTLFADVERSIGGSDESGWEVCTIYDPDACARNRAVLTGFLQRIVDSSFPIQPGVYTSPYKWVEFFGKEFIPQNTLGEPQPFVLWLAGCGITTGVGNQRTPLEVQEDLPTALESVLGGMKARIWQHHIDDPDFDALTYNPWGYISPLPGSIAYNCTCGGIEGSCPQ